MKILSAAQMAEVDRLTTEIYRIPSLLLMESAGRGVVEALEAVVPGLGSKRVYVFCGKGNNGGDGLVAARHLALRGGRPQVFLFADPAALRGDALANWEMLQSLGLRIEIVPAGRLRAARLRRLEAPEVLIDALFGTGLRGPLGGDFRPVVDWINRSKAYVAAVDLPSGLLADLPEVPGPAVSARLTVAFTAPKLAHLLPPAADHVGDLRVVAIGSPPELLDNPEYRVELVDPAMVARALPPRPRDGHKGTFGHVHVVAGSRGKSGAALMTGMAALRSGAGLVTLWLPRGLQRDVIGKFPELMTEFLPDTARGTSDRAGADAVLEAAAEGDVLVVGPGLTTEPGTRALVEELVRRSKVPVVLDADGLNAFAGRFAELRNDAGAALVLTPHPGEMARLAGTRIGEVQRARIETARGAAEARGVTIVLKGYRTVTATPSRRVLLNPTGNPGMATAGSGDILAGIAGRFVAGWQRRYRGANAEALAEHVAAAVYLHGLAGDLAAAAVGTESLVATDLLPHLPAAFRSVAGPGPGPA